MDTLNIILTTTIRAIYRLKQLFVLHIIQTLKATKLNSPLLCHPTRSELLMSLQRIYTVYNFFVN